MKKILALLIASFSTFVHADSYRSSTYQCTNVVSSGMNWNPSRGWVPVKFNERGVFTLEMAIIQEDAKLISPPNTKPWVSSGSNTVHLDFIYNDGKARCADAIDPTQPDHLHTCQWDGMQYVAFNEHTLSGIVVNTGAALVVSQDRDSLVLEPFTCKKLK